MAPISISSRFEKINGITLVLFESPTPVDILKSERTDQGGAKFRPLFDQFIQQYFLLSTFEKITNRHLGK